MIVLCQRIHKLRRFRIRIETQAVDIQLLQGLPHARRRRVWIFIGIQFDNLFPAFRLLARNIGRQARRQGADDGLGHKTVLLEKLSMPCIIYHFRPARIGDSLIAAAVLFIQKAFFTEKKRTKNRMNKT